MRKFYVLVDDFWCVDVAGGAMRKRGDEVEFKDEASVKHLLLSGHLGTEKPQTEGPLPLFDNQRKGKNKD